MAILFADGFDTLNTMSNLSLRWNYTNTPVLNAAGLHGTKSIYFNNYANIYTKNLGNNTSLYVGCAIYCNGSSADGEFFGICDSSNVNQICLWYNNTNKMLSLRRNTSDLATAFAPIPIGRWFYLEVYVNIHDTTGAYEVRIDGVTKTSASGVDTRNGNAYASMVEFAGKIPSEAPMWGGFIVIDDIYISNSGFLGHVRVDSLLPNGNGNSSQFTGSDGNSVDNYALVDDTGYSATDYVEGATTGLKDTYAFADLTATPATIHAVQTELSGWLSSGTVNVSSVVRSGGSDYNGTTTTPSATASTIIDIWETDPATAVAWTESGVNSAEFGVRTV